MNIDIAQADYLLTTTRSVRRRLDLLRPVDPGTIRKCLEIAQQAPTAAGNEASRWVVVTDADIKGRIGSIYQRASNDLVRVQDKAHVDRSSPQWRSATALNDRLGEVPVLVVVCIERAEWERSSRFPLLAAAHAYGSVFPAVWSFKLACRARGLGSCFVAAHLRYAQEVSEILGLPPTFDQAGLIAVAHTLGGGFRQAARRPTEEIVRENRWS